MSRPSPSKSEWAKSESAKSESALPGPALPGGPTLLGIGAAKAGTTWLAGILAAHPDIFVHPQKELNALLYADLDARIDEYLAYFTAAGERPVRCDFSVRYLSAERAPAAAARLAPDARLLMVLRNPIDQIQSHYWHIRRQNFHQAAPVANPPDLFEALDRYPELLLEPALYGKHLERWLAHFPRQQLHLVDYTDIRQRPAEALAGIVDFLGVAPFDFAPIMAETSETDSRAGVQPRAGVAGWLFPRLYASVARGPYMWLKRTIGVRTAETLKRHLRLRQVSERVFFTPGYPRLDEADRRRLYERVSDDVDRLAARLSVDVSGWRPQ